MDRVRKNSAILKFIDLERRGHTMQPKCLLAIKISLLSIKIILEDAVNLECP